MHSFTHYLCSFNQIFLHLLPRRQLPLLAAQRQGNLAAVLPVCCDLHRLIGQTHRQLLPMPVDAIAHFLPPGDHVGIDLHAVTGKDCSADPAHSSQPSAGRTGGMDPLDSSLYPYPAPTPGPSPPRDKKSLRSQKNYSSRLPRTPIYPLDMDISVAISCSASIRY